MDLRMRPTLYNAENQRVEICSLLCNLTLVVFLLTIFVTWVAYQYHFEILPIFIICFFTLSATATITTVICLLLATKLVG